jgi:hypothetical protein
MQPLRSRIGGNDNIWVIAKPLQAAVPYISMNVIIGTGGQPKKFNVPHSGQDEPEEDDAPGKSGCCKKLADPEEIHDARKGQRGIEVWPTPITEVA